LSEELKLAANVMQIAAFVLSLVSYFIWLYNILVLYGAAQTPWVTLVISFVIALMTIGYMCITRQYVWLLGSMFGISSTTIVMILKILEQTGAAVPR